MFLIKWSVSSLKNPLFVEGFACVSGKESCRWCFKRKKKENTQVNINAMELQKAALRGRKPKLYSETSYKQ